MTDRKWPLFFALALLLGGCVTTDDDDTSDDDDTVDDDDTADDDDSASAGTAAELRIEPTSPRSDESLSITIEVPARRGDGTDYPSYRTTWTADGEAQAAYDDAFVVPASATLRGEVWSALVVPYDPDGDGPSSTDSVTIGNSPPTLDSVLLGPPNPLLADALLAEPQGFADVDGDDASYGYAWYLDGVELTTVTTAELPAGTAAVGVEVYVVVTPSDGDDAGDSVESNHVVIGNATPTITDVAVSPSSGTEADVFTCTPSGWADADGDAEGYEYAWFVDAVPAGTSATLDGTSFDKGQSIWCSATPFDGTVLGTPLTSAAVTIDNSPPSVTSADIAPALPLTGDELSVVALGWADLDPADVEAYDVEWFVAGSSFSSSLTLPANSAVRGQDVYAIVTPNDGEATGSSVTTATVTIGNTPPSMVSVAISSSPDYTSFTAVPSGFADADGDSASYNYEWFLNGSSAATGPTFAPGALAVGSTVQVSATPDDGIDLGAPVTSVLLTLSPAVSVSPAAQVFGDLEVGCTGTQSFVLTNTGSSSLNLSSVALVDVGGTGEVTLTTPVTPGTVVAPGDSMTLSVDYVVLSIAAVNTQLVVDSDDPVNPTLVVPITGAAHYGPIVVDSFTAVGAQYTYVLDDPAANGSIEVVHNGTVITAWTYDASTDTVELDAALSPAPVDGDTVDVTYAISANSCVPNSPPVAVVDVTSSIVCEPVTFTGINSTDIDGDPLIYEWSLESVPTASLLTADDLVQTAPETVVFDADVEGDFTVGLTVYDTYGVASALGTNTATVVAGLNPANTAPVPDLGADLGVTATASCSTSQYGVVSCNNCNLPSFTLDDSLTVDADSYGLLNAWALAGGEGNESLTVSADGSTATVQVPAKNFGAYGTYVGSVDLQLTATDCEGASGTDVVTLNWTCTFQ